MDERHRRAATRGEPRATTTFEVRPVRGSRMWEVWMGSHRGRTLYDSEPEARLGAREWARAWQNTSGDAVRVYVRAA